MDFIKEISQQNKQHDSFYTACQKLITLLYISSVFFLAF